MKKKTSRGKKGNDSLPLILAGGGILAYLLLTGKNSNAASTNTPDVLQAQPGTTQGNGIIATASNLTKTLTSLNILPAGTNGVNTTASTVPTMSRSQALGIIVAAKSGRTAASFSGFADGYLIAWAKGITNSYTNKTITKFYYPAYGTAGSKIYSIATGTAG